MKEVKGITVFSSTEVPSDTEVEGSNAVVEHMAKAAILTGDVGIPIRCFFIHSAVMGACQAELADSKVADTGMKISHPTV